MAEQHVAVYGQKRIPVPDGWTQEQVKAQMARFFPELADPKIESKKDGDKTEWVFSKKAGTKGAGHCPSCGELLYSIGRHTCSPRFEARYDHDEDSDFVAVHAIDGEAAAAAFHERNFSAMDYATSVTVIVRDAQRRRCTFQVTVEAVPEFSAREQGEWGAPEPDPDTESEGGNDEPVEA